MADDTDLMSQRVSVDDILESDCRFLYEIWNSLRDGRSLPRWEDFELQLLPARVIAYVRVVDVHSDPFDLVYRFWGTGLVEMLGEERTGKSLTQLPAARAPQAVVEYETVIRERVPFAFIYNAKTAKPVMPLFTPAIRLPFSDGGDAVEKIVTYSDLHTDRDKWRRFYEARRKRKGAGKVLN